MYIKMKFFKIILNENSYVNVDCTQELYFEKCFFFITNTQMHFVQINHMNLLCIPNKLQYTKSSV